MVAARTAAPVPTPAELYGELFERVQLSAIYPDSKTFVDALPNRAPGSTLATIQTVDLVPPDLNSLLCQVELTIVKGCALSADTAVRPRWALAASGAGSDARLL